MYLVTSSEISKGTEDCIFFVPNIPERHTKLKFIGEGGGKRTTIIMTFRHRQKMDEQNLHDMFYTFGLNQDRGCIILCRKYQDPLPLSLSIVHRYNTSGGKTVKLGTIGEACPKIPTPKKAR